MIASWNNYRKVKIGEITPKNTGETIIPLNVTQINPADFINLTSLELQPIS